MVLLLGRTEHASITFQCNCDCVINSKVKRSVFYDFFFEEDANAMLTGFGCEIIDNENLHYCVSCDAAGAVLWEL